MNSFFKKAQKLQKLLPVLQSYVTYVHIHCRLNNLYGHIQTSQGAILFSISGGCIKVPSSKRNSNYTFELLLAQLALKLGLFHRGYVVLSMDLVTLKRKRLILKVFQKHQIVVIGISVQSVKAFNGVRLSKRRRL